MPREHFNPRPPWGGRLEIMVALIHGLMISIHALRGEGDAIPRLLTVAYINFNPRPPWGGRQGFLYLLACNYYFNPRPPWGGRLLLLSCRPPYDAFQSTPSVGRATTPQSAPSKCNEISIHALRGEGDFFENVARNGTIDISIHALRGEGDTAETAKECGHNDFNPRPPWGGRPEQH